MRDEWTVAVCRFQIGIETCKIEVSDVDINK